MNYDDASLIIWIVSSFSSIAMIFRKNDIFNCLLLFIHFLFSLLNNFLFKDRSKKFRSSTSNGIFIGLFALPSAIGALEENEFHITLSIGLIFDIILILMRSTQNISIGYLLFVPSILVLLIAKILDINFFITLISIFMSLAAFYIIEKHHSKKFTIGESLLISMLCGFSVPSFFLSLEIERLSNVLVLVGILALGFTFVMKNYFFIFLIFFSFAFEIFDFIKLINYIITFKKTLFILIGGAILILSFLIPKIFYNGSISFFQTNASLFLKLILLILIVLFDLYDLILLRLLLSALFFVNMISESLRFINGSDQPNKIDTFIDLKYHDLSMSKLSTIICLVLPILILRNDIPGGLYMHIFGIAFLITEKMILSFTYIQKHMWPGTNKYIETTFGLFFVLLILHIIIQLLYHLYYGNTIKIIPIAIPTLLCSLEATFTSQNYYITLPFLMIPLTLFFHSLFL